MLIVYGRGGLRQGGRRREEGRVWIDSTAVHCSPLQLSQLHMGKGSRSDVKLKLKLKLDDRR